MWTVNCSSHIAVFTGLCFLHSAPVMPVHRLPQDDWWPTPTVQRLWL